MQGENNPFFGKRFVGEDSPNWKHGKTGTKEYKKMIDQARRRGSKSLNIKTIQLVYEDNIKKYGTLTCYLCSIPIEFGKDNLEHKTPLSRGGDNEYSNLAVSCKKCNFKKHTKTEQEFRQKMEENNEITTNHR